MSTNLNFENLKNDVDSQIFYNTLYYIYSYKKSRSRKTLPIYLQVFNNYFREWGSFIQSRKRYSLKLNLSSCDFYEYIFYLIVNLKVELPTSCLDLFNKFNVRTDEYQSIYLDGKTKQTVYCENSNLVDGILQL